MFLIQQRLTVKGAFWLASFAALVGGGIYLGERWVRSKAEWTPVKAQLRRFRNSGKYHPIPDPAVGFVDPPNVRQWFATTDFEYLAETDFCGFPNRMPWPSKIDVLFLGDSLILGVGVGIDRDFSRLVGRALPDGAILNLGIAGAAPNRQLRAYRKFGASFRPRLVVACIYLAADLDGQLPFDAWLNEGAKTDYNSFRLSFGDQLHPKSFWGRVQGRCFLCGKMTELALRATGFPDRFSFPTGQEVLLDAETLRVLEEGLSPQDRRLALISSSLKEIRALAESQGAQLLVMLIPSKEETYASASLPGVLKPVHSLEQSLREQKFSVLSLYEPLWKRGKEQPVFFTLDIHLNAYGNQVVADCLVDWLRKNRLLGADETPVKATKAWLGASRASS